MSVITTYFNDNAQTPLNLFVVHMLYSQFCNKCSHKSNRWSLGLSLSVASSTVGAISSSQSSSTLLIAVNRVPWRISSKSTFVHTKMGNVSKTTRCHGNQFCENMANSALSSLWHSETKCDNAMYMRDSTAPLMPVYRVKFWWRSVQ